MSKASGMAVDDSIPGWTPDHAMKPMKAAIDTSSGSNGCFQTLEPFSKLKITGLNVLAFLSCCYTIRSNRDAIAKHSHPPSHASFSSHHLPR